MLVMEGTGVATDQWFGAMAQPGTPFASTSLIPLCLGLSVLGGAVLTFYYRHLDRPYVEHTQHRHPVAARP